MQRCRRVGPNLTDLRSENAWLPAAWFAQPVVDVARALVGRMLVVDGDNGRLTAVMTEVEAYGDATDPASHFAFRRGGSARVMGGPPGVVYVYRAHGVHACFNIVCEPEGAASAVLVRGVLLLPERQPVSGPGRTARALEITTDDHGVALNVGRIRVSMARESLRVTQTPRINVPRAPHTPWRFVGHLRNDQS